MSNNPANVQREVAALLHNLEAIRREESAIESEIARLQLVDDSIIKDELLERAAGTKSLLRTKRVECIEAITQLDPEGADKIGVLTGDDKAAQARQKLSWQLSQMKACISRIETEEWVKQIDYRILGFDRRKDLIDRISEAKESIEQLSEAVTSEKDEIKLRIAVRAMWKKVKPFIGPAVQVAWKAKDIFH